MTAYQESGYSVKKTLFISVIILIFGVVFSWYIFSTEPEAKREGATKKTPMLVETKVVDVGDFTPYIEVMGTVIPSQEIQLRSRVSGEVTQVSDSFMPGRVVKQGSGLVQLDSLDYQNQLQQRKSELSQAQADLQIETGEQLAAERDFQRLGRQVNDTQKSLILREPQLASAKAEVMAAQAALNQAKLNLQRTEVISPLHAQIQNIAVNKGSQVNVGDDLAVLVGVESYWIEATMPVNQLVWLDQSFEQQSLPVKIKDRLAWHDQAEREGRLVSIMGRVDEETRMARVMVEVDDPLDLQLRGLPQLTLGAYVACQIPATELTNVARIDRQYVRKKDTLWLMVEGKLEIRSLNIVFKDEQYVYVRNTLNNGDLMVVTDLSRVIDGAALRLRDDLSDEN